VRYEPASKNPPRAKCQTGTRALQTAIDRVYPELIVGELGYGCYNYRRQTSGTGWSLHAEGRALDIGVASSHNGLGWILACDLTQFHVLYGVQRVIWDGHIWSIEEAGAYRPLRSTSQQHHDHLHVEQWWVGALRPITVADEYAQQLAKKR
jgi:hypothetical protein